MRAILQPIRHCLVLPVLALLASCGGADDSTVSIAVIGKSDAAFSRSRPLSPAAAMVRGATSEGLVSFDKDGRIAPALADRWIVTDDGLSYIFRLRDGLWSDGSSISAETAAEALRQAIASVRNTPLEADLTAIRDVRTMASRVVELRLASPQPDLLQALGRPELALLRKGAGTGSMRLRRDRDDALLRPVSPVQRGLPPVEDWESRARSVRLVSLPAREAVARFDRGEVDAVFGGTFADLALAEGGGLTGRKAQIDPVSGLFGLVVVRQEGFLALPEHREAIAMAIDREQLESDIGIDGWLVTTRILPPGMSGDTGAIGERWLAMSIEERKSTAAARVAGWAAKNSQPRLRLALPEGPGADVLFARLEKDLREVGLAVQRVPQGAPAELRLLDAVASQARLTWFLDRLGCRALAGPCSQDADRLAARAREEADAAKRSELFAQAEEELTKANVYIPLGLPLRWSLLRRATGGFATNRWAIHPILPMTIARD